MDFFFDNPHLVLLIVGILLTPLWIKLALRQMQRHHEKLREIAMRLGLTFKDPAENLAARGLKALAADLSSSTPMRTASAAEIERMLNKPIIGAMVRAALPWDLSGHLDGATVRAYPLRRDKHAEIHYLASFPTPLTFTISITPEHFGHKLGKALSQQMRDVQLGDPAFDRKLFVRGDNAAAIQNWILHGNRKNVLLEFFAANSNASLDQNGLRYVQRHSRINLETFRTTFDLLTSTLRQLA